MAPVSLSAEINREYSVVHHFRVRTSAWFVGRVITLSNPKVERIVEQQLRRNNGDAVVNLKINGRDTFLDFLTPIGAGLAADALYYFALSNDEVEEVRILSTSAVAGLVGVLVSSRTVFVEGDVVRYR
jgi:hypothetical protein